MQNTKDSFFAVLRDRLSVVNSARTVLIDGQLRPGILVCENEVAGLEDKLSDVFCVNWGTADQVAVDSGPVAIDCTISYKTAGSTGQNGINRGRMLSAMDEELYRMLKPPCTPKMDFANGVGAEIGGNVFWSEAKPGDVEENGRYVNRAATLKVHFYREVK